MPSTTKNPFSGDVSQVINPWQWWGEYLNDSTNSLISINNYKSNEPELEATITKDVAGYGMQLGRVIDALQAVIETMPAHALHEEQKQAIEAFTELAQDIQQTKQEHLLKQYSLGNIDRMIDNLRALKQEDADLYQQVLEKLQSLS